MKRTQITMVLLVLILLQLACNRPNGEGAQIPAPNQTLTALFAFTPAGTSTSTLPPVVTATQPAGALPTNTLTSATAQPAATQAQPNPTAVPPTAAQPSATVPGVRPRSAVVAKFLTTAPTLDGDWAEWKDITTEYPATNVVFGNSNWANADDLAASFHVGWDNNNLYVAVKVIDDRYVQNASGDNLFKGDSLEILLDTKLQEDFFYNRLSPDDFQLGIAPGRPDPSGTKEAYLWLPANVAGNRSGVQIASLLETGQYRVEAAIPWNVFETTPAEGRHYGFGISVSDNDDPGQNLQQTMISNVASRDLTDPTTWGDLLLSR